MDPHVLILFKVALAIVLGGVIGYERERSGHYAGIRTHILVCLTSAALISVFSFTLSSDSLARIAAALMTGIGFIGAGTILKPGEKVKGLTTAASIWGVAGLGLIIGFGAVLEAAVITFLIVLVLEMRVFSLLKRKL